MDFSLRDLHALSAARRSVSTTLEGARVEDAEAAEGINPPPEPSIATALEALRAVLPATFVALYSTGVILLQNLANATGASERAREQAELGVALAGDSDALAAELAALSVEPQSLAILRVLFAVAATILIAFYAYRKAQVPSSGRVIFEPIVVTGAFIAWALAAPGTFLAAYLNATDLAAATIGIAFIAALALFVVSSTKLKNRV